MHEFKNVVNANVRCQLLEHQRQGIRTFICLNNHFPFSLLSDAFEDHDVSSESVEGCAKRTEMRSVHSSHPVLSDFLAVSTGSESVERPPTRVAHSVSQSMSCSDMTELNATESIHINYDLAAGNVVTRSAMCVPLMNAEGVVMAVMKLINKYPSNVTPPRSPRLPASTMPTPPPTNRRKRMGSGVEEVIQETDDRSLSHCFCKYFAIFMNKNSNSSSPPQSVCVPDCSRSALDSDHLQLPQTSLYAAARSPVLKIPAQTGPAATAAGIMSVDFTAWDPPDDGRTGTPESRDLTEGLDCVVMFSR